MNPALIEKLQKKDKEGLLVSIGVMNKQAADKMKELKAEGQKWKTEADNWKAKYDKLKAEAEKSKADAKMATARVEAVVPYRSIPPGLEFFQGPSVGRENMSPAQVDNLAAKGELFRATIPEASSLPTHLLLAAAAEAKVTASPSTKAEARAQVEELKAKIEDVEARMREPTREIDVANRKVRFLLAEKKALDKAMAVATRFLVQGCKKEDLLVHYPSADGAEP